MQNKIDLTTQKIDKICVLMMGLLGDVAMRTPILNQIKRIYPNAKMSVVVDKIGSQVLKNNPDIDEMIIIDRKKANKFKYICSKISVQAKLILGSFDLIIDLYMGRSSCNMAKFSFAKYQIGILHGQFWSNKNLKCHKFEHEFANPYHITNGLFEILQYFNVKQNSLDTKPIVHVDAKIDEKMRNYSEELRIKHYLLSLGSGGLEKLLDMQKSFELAEYMYKKYELIPAIFLNPTQEYLQEKFVSEFLEPDRKSVV